MILFRGDFSTGNLSQWAIQDATTNPDTTICHFGTVKIDPTVKSAGGKPSARFDLPASPTVKTRAQLIKSRQNGLGTDDYYTFRFLLPPGWTAAGGVWGTQMAEVNYQVLHSSPGGPAIALQLHANTLDPNADWLTLSIAAGKIGLKQPYYPVNLKLDAIPPGQLALNVWHELILHVRWAQDNTGLAEIWHRLEGQSAWVKTLSSGGHPTLQTNPDGTLPLPTLDVIHAYRGPATVPTHFWQNGFTRSDSFADALAEFPDPPTALTLGVHEISRTAFTVTAGWTPSLPGVTGYRFTRPDGIVSTGTNPAQAQTRWKRMPGTYTVEALPLTLGLTGSIVL